MAAFELLHTRYLLSLVNDTVTDEIRNALLESKENYGKDDIYSQVLVCFLNLMKSHGMDVDTVMERYEREYNALGMQEVMGDYSQYKDFFRLCAVEMRNGSPCLDSAYALAEPIDECCDAIKYGAGTALLRYLVFSKRITSELEFSTKMMELTDKYPTPPPGYFSIRTICEVVINNKTAIN